MKISILIPTFKPKNYLEKCLLSLENQSLSKDNFCVYIALNGEKEDYENYILALLDKMSFKYKYIYISQAGVSNARNTLLDMSNEEYVVFLDDDDLISNNYLENLLLIADKNYMGIANIYNFEDSIKSLKENYIGRVFSLLKNGETSKYKARKYYSSPMAKILHRSMIQNVKFDRNVSKGEDSLFMAIISKNIKGVKKTPKDTCYYVYERVGSATRKKNIIKEEIKTIMYLTYQYIKLFFNPKYEKLFILTRIVATIRKLLQVKGKKYE